MRRALIIAEWALAVLAVLIALAAWLNRISTPEGASIFFNADVIYPASLVDDVLVRGHPFRQWSLTPAPYLFPDVAIAAVSRSLFSKPEWAQYATSFTQVAVLLAVAVAMTKALDGSSPTAVSFVALALLAGLGPGSEPLSQLWLPAYHCGAVIFGLGATWLVVRRKIVALAVVGVLAGVSDGLFVVGWSVPAMIIALRAERRDRAVWLVGAISGIVGLITSRYALPFRRGALPAVTSLDFARAWADWLTFDPVLRWGLPILTLAVLALSWHLPTRRRVGALIVLGTFASIGSIVATGTFVDTGWSRYLLLPLISSGLFVATQLVACRVLVACLVPFAFAGLPAAWPAEAAERGTAACIDALATSENVTHVVSDYWHAKPLALFAQNATVIAFEPRLQNPQLGIASRQSYRGLKAGLIISEGLENVPTPSEVLKCGSVSVFIYRGEAREALQHVLQQRIEAAIGRDAPRVR